MYTYNTLEHKEIKQKLMCEKIGENKNIDESSVSERKTKKKRENLIPQKQTIP